MKWEQKMKTKNVKKYSDCTKGQEKLEHLKLVKKSDDKNDNKNV